MRFFVLLVVQLSVVITAFTQSDLTHLPKYYLEIGTGPSTHNGAFYTLGGTALYKNRWLTSLGYQHFDMSPKNLPDDYEQGYTMALIIPLPDEMPSMNMKSIYLTAGRYFPLGRKTWITTEAGLAVTNGETFTFMARPVEQGSFYKTSNYVTTHETKTGAGGIIKGDFTWAFVPYVGLGVGAFANMNSLQSTVGFEIKLIAGWLNSKKVISQ